MSMTPGRGYAASPGEAVVTTATAIAETMTCVTRFLFTVPPSRAFRDGNGFDDGRVEDLHLGRRAAASGRFSPRGAANALEAVYGIAGGLEGSDQRVDVVAALGLDLEGNLRLPDVEP